MSSKKRRAKRKISTLVKMDQTRMRMSGFRGGMFFEQAMRPLGFKLKSLGLEPMARQALKDAGTNLR